MGLGKVKDVIEMEHIGKLVKLQKDNTCLPAWYLIIKHNAEHWHDFVQFVRLPFCHVLYWDSMENDEVLEIRDFPKIIGD